MGYDPSNFNESCAIVLDNVSDNNNYQYSN